MKYASLCSGIGAPEYAFNQMGWQSRFCAEIEPFPCAVLNHHFPHTPNHGNIERFKEWPVEPLDLLVAGTPCQAFSIAGLRKGLDDPRGNLTLTALAIVERYQPRWFLWENVVGVLSHDKGRTFGTFLGGLGQLGYGFAYRVLDAQYVRTCGLRGAVPQRRRRVFVVGCLGDWRRAAAVLFDAESLRGNPPPRRQSGQRVTGSLSARAKAGGGLGTDFECAGGLQVAPPIRTVPYADNASHEGQLVCGTINASGKATGSATQQDAEQGLLVAHSLRGEGFDASEDGTGRGTPIVPCVAGALNCMTGIQDPDRMNFIPVREVAFSVTARDGKGANGNADPGNLIAFPERMSGTQCASAENVAPAMGSVNQTAIAFQPRFFTRDKDGRGNMGEAVNALQAESGQTGKGDAAPCIAGQMGVRRLTPLECERLQAFPDNWTKIPFPIKIAADGPRYRALGNSMATNVISWLAERIQMADSI